MDLDEILCYLPHEIAARAHLAALGGIFPADHILDRFYRCIIADRIAIHHGIRTPVDDYTYAAKRTILHAMGLCAARGWPLKMHALAKSWGYPREHLYRAASNVSREMGLEHWEDLRKAMIDEGIWPYEGGFVMEILGAPSSFCMELPLPLWRGESGAITRYFPFRLPTTVENVVQVVVNRPPTRPMAIVIEQRVGGFFVNNHPITPLETLQRAWEITQLRHEVAQEEYEKLEGVG